MIIAYGHEGEYLKPNCFNLCANRWGICVILCLSWGRYRQNETIDVYQQNYCLGLGLSRWGKPRIFWPRRFQNLPTPRGAHA